MPKEITVRTLLKPGAQSSSSSLEESAASLTGTGSNPLSSQIQNFDHGIVFRGDQAGDDDDTDRTHLTMDIDKRKFRTEKITSPIDFGH